MYHKKYFITLDWGESRKLSLLVMPIAFLPISFLPMAYTMQCNAMDRHRNAFSSWILFHRLSSQGSLYWSHFESIIEIQLKKESFQALLVTPMP